MLSVLSLHGKMVLEAICSDQHTLSLLAWRDGSKNHSDTSDPRMILSMCGDMVIVL